MRPRFPIVLLPLLAIACGGEPAPAPAAEPARPEAAKPEPAPAPAPEPAAPVIATPDAEGIVRMTGDDAMKFNATRIEVKAGEKVKLELAHVGKMPKAAMGHNLVVLAPGTDPMAFAQKAATAVATEYVPEGDKAVLAKTKLVGGGESDTIEFELPGPGEYPFLCTFPGHAGLMKGVLVAK